MDGPNSAYESVEILRGEHPARLPFGMTCRPAKSCILAQVRLLLQPLEMNPLYARFVTFARLDCDAYA